MCIPLDAWVKDSELTQLRDNIGVELVVQGLEDTECIEDATRHIMIYVRQALREGRWRKE